MVFKVVSKENKSFVSAILFWNERLACARSMSCDGAIQPQTGNKRPALWCLPGFITSPLDLLWITVPVSLIISSSSESIVNGPAINCFSQPCKGCATFWDKWRPDNRGRHLLLRSCRMLLPSDLEDFATEDNNYQDKTSIFKDLMPV